MQMVRARRASPLSPGSCPAPTLLTNQALKPVPEANRTQVIDRREGHQRQNDGKTAAECPVERLGAERAPPNCLDRVEKQMSSIQHRNWQEVDESQIN